MKKYLFLTIFVLFAQGLSLNAMEREPGEESPISLEDAKVIYGLLLKDNFSSPSEYSQEEYEKELHKIIPVLAKYHVPFQTHYFDPLRNAALQKNIELIKFLIRYGANPNFLGMGGSPFNIISSVGMNQKDRQMVEEALLSGGQ